MRTLKKTMLMILLLFILFGILVISAIVFYADEEIDILHEMPDVDSSIFKHELREFFTLIPFFFMVGVVITNLILIKSFDILDRKFIDKISSIIFICDKNHEKLAYIYQ